MDKQSFGKDERVRKRKDYQRIYQQGVRINLPNFVVILHCNQLGLRRLGVVAGKKTGNAVKRNRIKRLVREFFRLNKERLPYSKDIVIIVKRKIPFLKYKDVCGELGGLFEKQ